MRGKKKERKGEKEKGREGKGWKGKGRLGLSPVFSRAADWLCDFKAVFPLSELKIF